MRCYKCDGCICSYDQYRPAWCDDDKCPQGGEMPEEERKIHDEWVNAFFMDKK